MAAKEKIKTEQEILKINADLYKMSLQLENMLNNSSDLISTKEKRELGKGINEIKQLVDGK